jgi:TRAP-type C4-dicarboxylate transport system permease small subunit
MKAFNIFKRIEAASYRWNWVIMIGGSIVILAIILLVVADVSGRYLFNSPIKGSLELSGIMLAIIAFLCFSYALIQRTHIRMTLILDRLPVRLKLIAEILAGIAGIVFFLLLDLGGIKQFWDSFVVRELMPATITIPYWIPKMVLPIGVSLMVVQWMIYVVYHIFVLLLKEEN